MPNHHRALNGIALPLAILLLGACSASSGGVPGSSSSGGSAGNGGAGTAGATSSGTGGGTSNGGATGSGGSSNGGSSSGGNANASGGSVGTAGSSGLGCANYPLCDDFESATPGGPPDATKWSVVSPNCSGVGKLSIDGSVAHGGSHSLRVDGGGGYCDHVFIGNQTAVPSIGKLLYGRLFVRLGAAFDATHTTFMAFHDNVDGKDLRMGAQNGALKWNRESNDASLPSQSPTGIASSLAPAANAWHCIQFEVDQNNGHISTQVDGVAVPGLQNDGVPTPDLDAEWLQSPWIPQLMDARFGWEAYGGQALTLWFDDIALAATPIPCN